jgi:hypothetical protein
MTLVLVRMLKWLLLEEVEESFEEDLRLELVFYLTLFTFNMAYVDNSSRLETIIALCLKAANTEKCNVYFKRYV